MDVVHSFILFTILIVTSSSNAFAYLQRGDSSEIPVPEMIQLPGGCFTMGSPASEASRQDNERPHRACVESFAIGKYEITFEEFGRFVEVTGYSGAFDRPDQWLNLPIDNGWGRGRRPVVYVNIDDALAYADWLSRQTGLRYRLPTETEWEYAARAGAATAFHYGPALTAEQANYNATRTYFADDHNRRNGDQNPGLFRRQTLPVGQFPRNAWGLHDMHGNVQEWTCSAYDPNYGGAQQRCSGRAGVRVSVRGGSWHSFPSMARSAARLAVDPASRSYEIGFRLVRESAGIKLPPALTKP